MRTVSKMSANTFTGCLVSNGQKLEKTSAPAVMMYQAIIGSSQPIMSMSGQRWRSTLEGFYLEILFKAKMTQLTADT